jgi:hypothetical protein
MDIAPIFPRRMTHEQHAPLHTFGKYRPSHASTGVAKVIIRLVVIDFHKLHVGENL